MELLSNISKALVLLFTVMLFGCGGGGGGSTQLVISSGNHTNQGYTGLITPATLDVTLARQAAEDYFFVSSFVRTFLFSGLFTFYEEDFISGKVLTVSCSGAGSSELGTKKNGSVATTNIEFQDCTEDGQTLSGIIIFDMDYRTTTLNIKLVDLNLSREEKVYFINGSIISPLWGALSQEGRNSIEVNLLVNSGVEQLSVEALLLPIPGVFNKNSDVWNGYFYYSNSGRIELNLGSELFYSIVSEPNSPYVEREFPYTGGPLTVSDASGNNAKFTPVSNDEVFIEFIPNNTSKPAYGIIPWIKLNVDNNAGGEIPVANESISGAGSLIQITYLNDAESIQLNGIESTDPENALLSYDWSIIQAPVGSASTIDNYDSAFPTFHPDHLGEYIIGLTVSDGILLSELQQITIHVGSNTSNLSSSPYWEATQPDGRIVTLIEGRPLTGLPVYLHAFSSIPEYLNINVTWEIAEKPVNSSVTSPVTFIEDWSFIPDKPGYYLFIAKISNGFGGITENQLRVDVEPYERQAIPIVYKFEGKKIVTVNEEFTLIIDQRVGAGPAINQTTILITDSPQGSSPAYRVESNSLSLTLNKPGRYVIEAVASNGIEESKPVSTVLYAYDELSVPFNIEHLQDMSAEKDMISLNVGDLNNDGRDDVVVSWRENLPLDVKCHTQILYGLASGGFVQSSAFEAPVCVNRGDVIDMNSDGKAELVFASGLSFYGLIFDENGGPSISFTLETDRLISDYVITDIDQDGLNDFIWAFNEINVGIAHSLQQPGLNFAPVEKLIYPGSPSGYLHIDDGNSGLNSRIKRLYYENSMNSLFIVYSYNVWDFVLDEIVDSTRVDELRFIMPELVKQETYHMQYPSDPENTTLFAFSKPVAADLDNDGVSEIIGTYYRHTTETLSVWKRDSDDNIYKINPIIIDYSSTEKEYDVADMNSDGDKDLLLFNNNGENEVSVLHQNNGIFNMADVIKTNTMFGFRPVFLTSDLNQDGDMDIVFYADETSEIKIIRKNKF